MLRKVRSILIRAGKKISGPRSRPHTDVLVRGFILRRFSEIKSYIPFCHITLWNIYLFKIMTKTIYSKDHKHVVEQLKKAREEAGLDQAIVAEKLGKTQSYISKIESGQRRVDIIVLKELAQIYKKPIDYFLK